MNTDGYSFDVFLSYKHDPVWSKWVLRLFLPAFESNLRPILPWPLQVYSDERINEGELWPRSLREGLAQSRLLVPILTTHYFSSAWCCRELGLMLARQELLGRGSSLQPPILIMPLILFDSMDFPDPARYLQGRSMHKYAYPDLTRSSALYKHFFEDIRGFAHAVHERLIAPPCSGMCDPQWLHIDEGSHFNSLYCQQRRRLEKPFMG